jgi:hypothetical protein
MNKCNTCNGKARARTATSWADLQRKKEEQLLKEMIEVNQLMAKLSKQPA